MGESNFTNTETNGRRERLVADYRDSIADGNDIRADEFLRRRNESPTSSILTALLVVDLEVRQAGGMSATVDFVRNRYPDNPQAAERAFESFVAGQDSVEDFGTALDETIAGSNPLAPDQDTGDTPYTEITGPLTTGPSTQFGDYKILNEIARGGMGVVYRARQLSLNRIVAIKMIKTGQLASDDELHRFQSEAEAAAQLDHPNIVPVFEVGEQNGRHFFSMGFVDGESLNDRLSQGPLPPREAATLLRSLAEAVRFAHEKGIVHRDLKPANVLIDRQGQPKITDFGLAKRAETDSAITATGQIVGTPSFMPPEQASGAIEDIGPAADIYSLGAMLYCLLTGRPPFQAANVMETLKQVLEREPVSPRMLNTAVDRDLETICLKCMRKEASQRYSSASALADDLGRYLDGQPILARPIGRVAKLWRVCKRYPLASTLIVLLIASAVVTGIVFTRMRAADARLTKERLEGQIELAQQRQQFAERQREISEQARRDENYTGLMKNVGLRRLAGKPGWTRENARDIELARNVKTRLRSRKELRDEAIAAHTAFDMELHPEIKTSVRPFCVAFSPSSKQIAIGQFKAGLQGLIPIGVYIRDIETGKTQRFMVPATISLRRKGSFAQDGVRAIAWTRDGNRLFVGMRSGRIARIDWRAGKKKPLIWQAHDDTVTRLVALPDGNRVISLADDYQIRSWDTSQLVRPKNAGFFNRSKSPKLIASFKRGNNRDFGLVLSHDGRLLAVGDSKAGVLIADSLKQIVSMDLTRPNFSRDGRWIFQYQGGGEIRIVDSETGRVLDRVPLDRHTDDGIRQMVVHPSETIVCVLRIPEGGRALQYFEILDLATGERLYKIPADSMADPVFSPDGRLFATPTVGGIRIHRIRGFAKDSLKAIGAWHPVAVKAMATSPTGNRIATLAEPVRNQKGKRIGHRMRTWQQGDRAEQQKSWTYPEYPIGEQAQIVFDHTGKRLFVSRLWERSAIFGFDANRGEPLKRFSRLVLEPRWLSVAKNGTLWVSHRTESLHAVQAYDRNRKKLTRFHDAWAFTRGGNQTINCVAAGDRWIVAGSGNGILLIAPTNRSGAAARLDPGSGYINCVAQFDSAKPWFAAGTIRGTILVREFKEGAKFQRLTGHARPINSIVISSDGNWIASGSRAGTIRLWKRERSGWQEYLKIGMTGSVKTLAFTHDDSSLAVLIEGERVVRMLHLARAKSRFERWQIE